eukprot:gene10785-11985_t
MLDQLPVYRQAGSVTSSDDPPYLLMTLSFTLLVFFFEHWLDRRQLRRFDPRSAHLPACLAQSVTQETFDKSIAYRKDVFSFKIVESVFDFLSSTAMLVLGYQPWAWDQSDLLAKQLAAACGYSALSPYFGEILTTWIFVAIFTLVSTALSLPFSLYSTFVIEQRHGFNKSTLALFLQDKLLTLALTFVFALPVLSAVVYIVRAAGDAFYFFVWIFLCAFSLLMLTVYPTWIAPLFNRYTELEAGPTRTAIEELAKRVDFPLGQVFQVDGSRRSAHSNAYFYGFFKNKRIVLYDTLLRQVDLQELLAILGHEIGHWRLWHTVTNFVVSQVYTFAFFAAFASSQHHLAIFQAFGFAPSQEGVPVCIGLLVFAQVFWGPIDKLLSLIMTLNSRTNEFGADAYAHSLGLGAPLASGLVKISVENLDNLVPDDWYSWYHYSHPPLVERLRALEEKDRKAE